MPDYAAAVGKGVKGLAHRHPQGISRRRHGAGDRSAVAAGRGVAEGRRRQDRRDVSLPHTKYALPVLLYRRAGGGSSNLARYDGVRYGLREAGRDVTRHV